MTRSSAELLLAEQLRQAGIPFEEEFRFAPPRRWRADFFLQGFTQNPKSVYGVLVEVEGGSFTGGHKRGRAYESDCEKHNRAVLMGYLTLRFTPAMVADGRALEVIREAIGIGKLVAI